VFVLLAAAVWIGHSGPPAYSQQSQNSTEANAGVANESGQAAGRGKDLNLLQITWDSKWWMLPIAVMSIIAVAVSVERAINLSRNRVIPESLVAELGRLGSTGSGFDPREAFRICQRHPSAAASVLRAMLRKVGRPHSEVEHAVKETSQREAQRLYNNVRWLNLAAGVCPLMGLIGTVWGMIVSFHQTTQLMPGQDKADFLAEGIYLALVTTLGGLAVAIPATILSHYFEGRIVNLFFQIDELVFNMLPQVERYEGRVRFIQSDEANSGTNGEAITPSPAATPQRE
jgi:biopolymer transport protein ExbB